MLARVSLTRTARALAAAPLGTAAIAASSSSSLAGAIASHTPAPCKRARLATPLQAARAFATTRAVHNGDALANANIFASSPDERVSVTSLTPSAGFTLSDGLVVPSPVLLIDGACFLWDVSHPTEGQGKNPMGFDWDGWTREKMQIFEALSPRPEILLVGTGTSTMFAPPAFKKYLNGLGIQVDVLDSRNAASTYNLLQEEGRRVAAALYPVSHLSARTGLVASTQPLLQRTRDKRIALPVRVEPKVFFANERTFLSWLNFTVVLGGLAVGLLNFGDRVGKISAGMFTLVAMSIMAYALVTYHWRANAIRKRGSGPYDDRLGPTVLCLALFAAVVTNFILRFTAA